MGDIAFFRLNDDQTKLELMKSTLENPKTHAALDLQSDNIKKTYQLLKGRGVRVDDLMNPSGFITNFTSMIWKEIN